MSKRLFQFIFPIICLITQAGERHAPLWDVGTDFFWLLASWNKHGFALVRRSWPLQDWVNLIRWPTSCKPPNLFASFFFSGFSWTLTMYDYSWEGSVFQTCLSHCWAHNSLFILSQLIPKLTINTRNCRKWVLMELMLTWRGIPSN